MTLCKASFTTSQISTHISMKVSHMTSLKYSGLGPDTKLTVDE
jgi:hypothetical protein